MGDTGFGEFVRELRRAKGLTTSELAEITGVSQSYISQLETGKRSIPSDEILLKLSKGLRIDYAEMLDKAGRRTSAFDSNIRSYIHLLIGDREKDFHEAIEHEFTERIGALFVKHGAQPNKTVTLIDGDGMKNGIEIAEQYADMILDVDDANFQWEVLQELQDIAHEYHIKWNPAYELGIREPRPVEIVDIIRSGLITYNGHSLDDSDRQRILDMLAVLFPDRK